MNNYQVIFNVMGYDFETINIYYEELGPDFTTNYEPLVGIKFYPSAVDYNIVTIVGDIVEEFAPQMVSIGIVGALKAMFYLAKKTLKFKDKYDQKTSPEIRINYNTYNIHISELHEGSFTNDLPEKVAKIIMEKTQSFNPDQYNSNEDQFDISVYKDNSIGNNTPSKEGKDDKQI